MPSKKTDIRALLRSLLQKRDYERLNVLSGENHCVIRLLISMSYDKENVISWRAIGAIGRITRNMPVEKVRTLIQRLLWMMREESGN